LKEKDTYQTILVPSEEVLFKEKNSKFFGYAFPVSNESQINNYIIQLKKQHHSARHYCYAWQIGTEITQYRVNDDGEPNNSAGQPIFGQIQSFNVTNILIVIVRYFGGTKLGVGGLISAYRTAAQMAMEASNIMVKTINIEYDIIFDYKNMNKVMRIIKEKNLYIINQQLEISCKIGISVRRKNSQEIFDIFNSIKNVNIKNRSI
jgi:uncharacterized YigZ family protein